MPVLKYRDPITGERVRIPTTENGVLTGTASGDLTGTYPAPHIAPGVVTDLEVASANKDGAAGVPSMRTIGAGSTQVVAGNDARLTNSRAPSGAATGDLVGNYPSPTPIAIKPPVKVVATTNVALSGLQTIDGVTLIANDRVLLTAQTTTSQNGIYLAASGAWARSADMNGSGYLVDGTTVAVAFGTVNADTIWRCTSTGAVPWTTSTASTWASQRTLNDARYLPKSLVDIKGDLLVGTADDTVGRLAVGTDGQVLTADAASAEGVKWAAAAGGIAVVEHGTNGAVARPSAAVVYWVGTATPANALSYDFWKDS